LVAAGRERVALGWAALAQGSLEQRNLADARHWLKKAELTQPKQLELARLSQALEQAEAKERVGQADAEAFAVARRHTPGSGHSGRIIIRAYKISVMFKSRLISFSESRALSGDSLFRAT